VRDTLRGVLLFACIATAAQSAIAQPFQSQPIRLVVPQAAGGQTDAIARLAGQALADVLGQPVVIVNHGGAGGAIGTDIVAKAPADGYTLLLGGAFNLALAPALRPDLPYDPIGSFTAIGPVARVAYGLAVNAKLPVRSVPELVAAARADPGRLNYGSSGIGSMSSLGAEMLKSAAAVDIVHVPYSGSAPAVAALVAGQIDMMFADLSLLLPHARGGALRLIATAGARRAAAAPELPTVAEAGIPGFDLDAWYGIVAPAGVPPAVVTKLRNALAQIQRSPEFRQRLARQGYDPIDNRALSLDAMIRSDIEKYSDLVRRANIKAAP
jgi:tripartite-type tricarboxylate transporter receptor subunit TctC